MKRSAILATVLLSLAVPSVAQAGTDTASPESCVIPTTLYGANVNKHNRFVTAGLTGVNFESVSATSPPRVRVQADIFRNGLLEFHQSSYVTLQADFTQFTELSVIQTFPLTWKAETVKARVTVSNDCGRSAGWVTVKTPKNPKP